MIPTCQAIACAVAIQRNTLFCPKHWAMVPANIQKWVWLAYEPGDAAIQKPSTTSRLAVKLAIGAIAIQEGYAERHGKLIVRTRPRQEGA